MPSRSQRPSVSAEQAYGISPNKGNILRFAPWDHTHGTPGDPADYGDIAAHIAASGTAVHGLGTMSTQNSNNVSVTGGSTTGLTLVSTSKIAMNTDGGLMVKLTNKTGANSVKGEIVAVGTGQNNSVIKIVVDVPNPFGVFWESGIADGNDVWIVVSGIADVYFVGNTTRGDIARGFLTADGGSYVTGQALAEAYPTAPFASDKHFYEIGHVLESRTGAGLAKCILHFN